MKSKVCPVCGTSMIKNGFTAAGKQRWRCSQCGLSSIHTNDVSSRDLKAFLGWLLSKDTQYRMPGHGRTFRRRIEPIWKIWPLAPVVDEIHKVIYVDGIYLARDVVILIARSNDYVLSWHLARSESSHSYRELLKRIAPPLMVVGDGGCGFLKAVRDVWPQTYIQRCLFHVFCQVRRYTTSRPRLEAGKELYRLAQELLAVQSPHQAQMWVDKYLEWCRFWDDFLSEKTKTDKGYEYTHIRLRKARNALTNLLRKQMLFTFLTPELTAYGVFPRTNNMIEGATNAKIREMLKNHRGLSLTRRIKAAFWLCYMDTECPKSATEILKCMPTDKDYECLQRLFGHSSHVGEPEQWGTGIVWEEFHHSMPYPYNM